MSFITVCIVAAILCPSACLQAPLHCLPFHSIVRYFRCAVLLERSYVPPLCAVSIACQSLPVPSRPLLCCLCNRIKMAWQKRNEAEWFVPLAGQGCASNLWVKLNLYCAEQHKIDWNICVNLCPWNDWAYLWATDHHPSRRGSPPMLSPSKQSQTASSFALFMGLVVRLHTCHVPNLA